MILQGVGSIVSGQGAITYAFISLGAGCVTAFELTVYISSKVLPTPGVSVVKGR